MTPYKEYGLPNLQLLLIYGTFTHTKIPAWGGFFVLKAPVLHMASSTSALTRTAVSPTAKTPSGHTNPVLLCLSSPQHQPEEVLPSILKSRSFTQSMEHKTAPHLLTSKLQGENFHAMEHLHPTPSPASTCPYKSMWNVLYLRNTSSN